MSDDTWIVFVIVVGTPLAFYFCWNVAVYVDRIVARFRTGR